MAGASDEPTLPAGAHSAPPTRLGRYALAELLGEGGMGVVHVGRDERLARDVAIKIARDGHDRLAVARFLREARITGQLEHPGIVPLHDLGQSDDGRPYIAMRKVLGTTLEERLTTPPASSRELAQRLGILVKIADAIGFAHSKGVIHRDLKPANVMVGGFGEVLVMDWGLARLLDERADPREADDDGDLHDALRTREGSIVGTPAYMAPEQAEGRVTDIGPGADVYALGAMLYQMLAGVPPFAGESVWQVIEQVTQGALAPPSTHVAGVPRELEAIVLRAMARDPARRYPSATAFRDDVEAFLADGLVTAARYSVRERLAKWSRRHRAAIGGLVAVLLAVVATAVVIAARTARARGERLAQARGLAYEKLVGLEKLPRLRQELEERPARLATLDAGARLADLERWRTELSRYLDARFAIDRALGLVPDDPQLRAWRDQATEALALVAGLAGDQALASQMLALPTGEDWPGRARALAALEAERGAGAERERREREWRRTRFAEIVARLSALREASELAVEESVFEVLAWRDGGTQGEVALAFEPLVRRAEQSGRTATWSVADVAVAAFCCRVLSRSDQAEALELLARWMGVVWSEELAVEAGVALCRTRRAEAHVVLDEAIHRLGSSSPVWSRVSAFLELVPRVERHHEDALAIAEGAQMLMHRGRLAEALVEFDRAIARDPRIRTIHAGRALARYRLGDFAGAIAGFSEALALYPAIQTEADRRWNLEQAVAHDNRGAAYARLGRLEEALRDFQRAQELGPDRAQSVVNHATALDQLAREEEALADLDRAIERFPGYAPAFALRGQIRKRRGHYALARPDLDRALELDRGNADHWRLRADLYSKERESEHAIRAISEAIALDPHNANDYVVRGMAQRDLGRLREAIADFGQALKVQPDHARALAHRGQLLMGGGLLDEAKVDLDRSIELEPGYSYAYANRSQIHLRRGETDAALRDTDRAIELGQATPPILHQRAWLHHQKGATDAALRDLSAALDRDPAFVPALVLRGGIRSDRRDFDGARADLERALELAPDDWNASWNLGLLHLVRRERERGLAALERAVALAPAEERPGLVRMLAEIRARK